MFYLIPCSYNSTNISTIYVKNKYKTFFRILSIKSVIYYKTTHYDVFMHTVYATLHNIITCNVYLTEFNLTSQTIINIHSIKV